MTRRFKLVREDPDRAILRYSLYEMAGSKDFFVGCFSTRWGARRGARRHAHRMDHGNVDEFEVITR